MSTSPKTLIVIAGPTAVGKTAVAIKIAQHFGTAIISADSRQCYKEMSIGTAKPTLEELSQVKHYFIDSHSITDNLNAADYESLALEYASQIFKDKHIAVVCGGTGLYIKALCEGIDEMPKSDIEIEKTLQAEFEQHGLAWLQEKVRREDAAFFEHAEQQNPARLIRGLAFKMTTGQSITQFKSGKKKERPFKIIKLALELPRPVLYDRINERVDIMMQQGLWQEAENLYPQRHLKNLQTVGYTEIFDCLDGNIDREKCVELIKQHSRNYAKRQLTWFRKDEAFKWFSPQDLELMLHYIDLKMQ